MNELVERFQTACTEQFTSGRRRNNYPEDIKAMALAYVEAASAKGVKFPKIAANLGITTTTLRQWHVVGVTNKAAQNGGTPRDLAAVPVKVLSNNGADDTLYIVQAGDALRIECRGADAVANLIRALA